MRDLSTEGFVTMMPRRGALVSELAPEDLDDIFEVRMALEVTECVLAAQRASVEEIERMRRCVTAAREAMEVICREHEQLADAIADRDVERARHLARIHVETSRRVATDVLCGQREA